ncbi:MAG: hypothetical protein ACXIT9_09070 [Nitritalea sp.]
MRALNETEIQLIKARLDRCLIAYQEIYDELLDHYISALEQESAENFLKKKEELDDTFSWSIIKGMEKDLQKMAWKEFTKVVLSSLQLWKLGWLKVIAILLVSIVGYLAFLYAGPEYFYTISLISIGTLLVAIIYHHRKDIGFNYSLDPSKHQPKKVLQTTIFFSFVFAFNLINLFAQLIPKLLNNSSYEQFAPIVFLIAGSLLIAMSLTIYQSINLKTFKLIKL